MVYNKLSGYIKTLLLLLILISYSIKVLSGHI